MPGIKRKLRLITDWTQVETNSDLMSGEEADMVRRLLRVVDTASVTLSQDGDFSRARFTLTLSEG
jgi:hypothetical protein